MDIFKAPQLNLFPGKCSIVVMDNDEAIWCLIEEECGRLSYLILMP
jgi:transposase